MHVFSELQMKCPKMDCFCRNKILKPNQDFMVAVTGMLPVCSKDRCVVEFLKINFFIWKEKATLLQPFTGILRRPKWSSSSPLISCKVALTNTQLPVEADYGWQHTGIDMKKNPSISSLKLRIECADIQRKAAGRNADPLGKENQE